MQTLTKLFLIALSAGLFMPGLLQAQTATEGWHATSLGGAFGLTALFGLFGVLLAVVGYYVARRRQLAIQYGWKERAMGAKH